jgi:hypothetical protein
VSRPDRSERPLKLHPAVEAALVHLVAAEHWLAHQGEEDATTLPPEDRPISLEAVESCEEAVGGWLTDEALALLTSETDALDDVHEMRLSMVGAHTERAHDLGLSKGLIAIGRGGHVWYCVPRRPEDEDRTKLIAFDDGDRSEHRVDLVRWLTERVEERLDDLEVDEAVQAELESELNIARFQPRLARAAKAEEGPARRVRHTKFGEGTVLREVRDGAEPKLTIRFDDGSEKTLLQRFVQDA